MLYRHAIENTVARKINGTNGQRLMGIYKGFPVF